MSQQLQGAADVFLMVFPKHVTRRILGEVAASCFTSGAPADAGNIQSAQMR